MKYSDMPDDVFVSANRSLVTGESDIVKTSIIMEFLENSCKENKRAFCISYQGSNELFIKQVCRECNVQAVIHRIDKRVLNSFGLWNDWYYLIEHYYSDARAEEVKAYLRFLFQLLKYMPEDTLFLNLYEMLDSVQNTMKVLSELNEKHQMTEEQYEKLKIVYLEVMTGAGYLEDIVHEIDAISLERVSVQSQRILYWCMVRKTLQSLDETIPIVINHIDGDDMDIIYDLLVELNSHKILFVSNDVFRNMSRKDFVSCFELSIFSRTSYMPSAKFVEELFGVIKKPKTIYSETYDRRIENNKWIDKLLKTNKTETYATSYEYEPMYSKEEICALGEELALFQCFNERGYTRCGKC